MIRTPRLARRGAAALARTAVLASLVVACAPAGPATWTYPPAGATPAAPSSPGTSESPAVDASPSGGTAPSASPSAPAGPVYTEVSSAPCPDSDFTCVTLAVPRDHTDAANGATWEVTYAIQRASGERLGTFVVITGGPGTSGISSADSYAGYYPASLSERYDLVFIDQRGIGMSEPIQCLDAAARWYTSTARAQDPAQRDAVAAAAEAFAADCVTEAGIADTDLPLYATRQAVEDLEAVRDHLGVDRLHLYGESYGTQFVQTYAATHPDRIAALFVDGPVDMAIDGISYYIEAARSAEDTLLATLDACTADETCAADVAGGDALAAYDDLRARLATAPLAFDFPTAAGTLEPRQLTVADLENAAFGYIYSPFDRSVLVRAIAAASQGNLVPLARAAYDSIGLDPETLAPEDDPTWSDAMYYAVECQDYAFYGDVADPGAALDAWLADGASAGINELRMGTSFYGDLPCVYWPSRAARDDRPDPIVDPDYPVFVLTSTTDPATPIANGMRIFGRLDDAWFLQTLGGPHIIFGWGESCPDEVIAAYLVEGTSPRARVTTCDGSVADAHVAIAPTEVAAFDDPLAMMRSMDDQVLMTSDYLYRLEDEPLTTGCDFGGALVYEPTDVGTDMRLDGCAFVEGLPMTGTASADDEVGTFTMDVTVGSDPLVYERDEEGATSVSGTVDGRPIDLDEAA